MASLAAIVVATSTLLLALTCFWRTTKPVLIVVLLPGVVIAGLLSVLALRRQAGRLPLLILAATVGGVLVVYVGGVLGLMAVLAGASCGGASSITSWAREWPETRGPTGMSPIPSTTGHRSEEALDWPDSRGR